LLPRNISFDKEGNRISTQAEAISHFYKTGNGKIDALIHPPDSPDATLFKYS
jgi:hypothetical protein